MNTLVVDQLREVLPATGQHAGLASASSLRVAAGMLANAAAGEVSATRVVGTLGRDDATAFAALVAQIAADYDLAYQFQIRTASYSVRFARR